MLQPKDAWDLIERHLAPLPPERVPRARALGRVVAAQIPATVDVPPIDVSAMDGYVVSGKVPTQKAIDVAFTVAAGAPPGAVLPEGPAARIMTGAPIPEGADRVVPVELSDGGTDQVVFESMTEGGAHIRRRGEISQQGEIIFEPGELITPGGLGQLATHGHTEVTVIGTPEVSFVTTGDEIVPPEAVPEPGQLRDSHTDFFQAALEQMGLSARSLGIASDDPDDLAARVEQGLSSDVLLLSGGVSMGAFDFVEEVLVRHGCEVLFDAVAVQPGKPMVTARHERGWVFALPGNPASVMVTFWLFVRPALRRLMGLEDSFWYGALRARLTGPLPAARNRDLFLPAEVRFGREVEVTPGLPAGSHDVAVYGRGTGLVRVPRASEARSEGEMCEVLPLVEWPVPRTSIVRAS